MYTRTHGMQHNTQTRDRPQSTTSPARYSCILSEASTCRLKPNSRSVELSWILGILPPKNKLRVFLKSGGYLWRSGQLQNIHRVIFINAKAEKFNNLGDKEVDKIITNNLEIAKDSAVNTISEVKDALGIN